MRTALVLAITSISSTAAAETRVTVGASAGLFHNKQDAEAGIDSTETLGLFGRAGLTKRLSAQLEITRHKSQDGCAICTVGTTTDIRVFSGLLVVDLLDRGRLVPTLMVGVGIDRDDGSFPRTGHHIEGGVGLEYRADSGLTIGVDGRLGGRTINESSDVILTEPVEPRPRILGPTMMREGEYRSVRLTLGIRF